MENLDTETDGCAWRRPCDEEAELSEAAAEQGALRTPAASRSWETVYNSFSPRASRRNQYN